MIAILINLTIFRPILYSRGRLESPLQTDQGASNVDQVIASDAVGDTPIMQPGNSLDSISINFQQYTMPTKASLWGCHIFWHLSLIRKSIASDSPSRLSWVITMGMPVHSLSGLV